jgi:hypothetical protein
MASIKMRFSLWLEIEPVTHFKVQGPLFYQFVPDKQNDAVYLTSEHDLHEIQVWFERRAKSRVDFCTGIAMERSLMKRSCAGRPFFRVGLRDEMLMPDVSGEELASLLRNPKALNEPFGQDSGEDPAYERLGKRVIRQLHPRPANFIATLRDQ